MQKTEKEKALSWFIEGNDCQNMDREEQEEFFEKHYAVFFDERGCEVDG